jgi:geranylgeranyl reductase family protein
VKEAFDVIILGAGPAGCAAAIGLHGSGLSVALLDKSVFPRDKICGDAISPDVVNQLGKLPIDAKAPFLELEQKTVCNAVRFISADYSYADITLYSEGISGYISPRLDFDAFMYEQATRSDAVASFLGVSVEKIIPSENGIEVRLKDGRSLQSDIILGADGAQSLVKRSLHGEKPDKDHYCAGLRMYYEGVTGFSEDNAIELHFYKELLPGYFWVFPLADGKANVGIGMLTSFIQKNRINLKKELLEIIERHPNVADRFKNARPLEEPQGFPLPLGSKKRSISGNRYLLLGDAASLINPLSGEGIANAIRSGRVAAEHLIKAFESERFDAAYNRQYDEEIYRRMWGELRLNYWVQRFMRNPRRSNWLVKHAIGHPLVKELVMSGFDAKNLFKRNTSR